MIRGKAEKIFLCHSLAAIKFILSSMLKINDENNPCPQNVHGNRIFDVVDFISLESFIEYLGTSKYNRHLKGHDSFLQIKIVSNLK